MYLEALKEEEMFHLRFSRLHDRRKSTTNAFDSYKLTNKLCLLYLEVKLTQNRWGCCISNKNAIRR